MNDLPLTQNGSPSICGSEEAVAKAVRAGAECPAPSTGSASDFSRMRSGFAIALHMHQPLIPAGGPDLKTAGDLPPTRGYLAA